MTDEEKKQLVDAVITQLKSEGTDVSNASIVSNANGIDYVVAYGKNGQIVRAIPTAISSEKVGATGYMNAYTEAGVYNINTSGGEDLPIDNQGAISARLTVLVTESGGNKVITQVLNLNNNEGGEGNVYIRSCQNGEWKAWGKLQTNVEVGQINTLDHLTDNGIYSGVFTDGTPTSAGTFYDTFVLIVINNYAVSIPTGNPQSISQLKYSLGLDGSISVASRKRDQYGYWDNWVSLDEKSLVEGEKTRAEQVENDIKSKAIEANGINFQTRDNVVALEYFTIEGVGDEITIPAATTEKAGVMSAEDKKLLLMGDSFITVGLPSNKQLLYHSFFRNVLVEVLDKEKSNKIDLSTIAISLLRKNINTGIAEIRWDALNIEENLRKNIFGDGVLISLSETLSDGYTHIVQENAQLGLRINYDVNLNAELPFSEFVYGNFGAEPSLVISLNNISADTLALLDATTDNTDDITELKVNHIFSYYDKSKPENMYMAKAVISIKIYDEYQDLCLYNLRRGPDKWGIDIYQYSASPAPLYAAVRISKEDKHIETTAENGSKIVIDIDWSQLTEGITGGISTLQNIISAKNFYSLSNDNGDSSVVEEERIKLLEQGKTNPVTILPTIGSYYNSTAILKDDVNSSHIRTFVKTYKEYHISGTASKYVPAYMFLDKNGKVVTSFSPEGTQIFELVVTPPDNAVELIVNTYNYGLAKKVVECIEYTNITELAVNAEKAPLKGKTILCLGDSITEMVNGNYPPRGRYSDLLATMSGANVINGGIGGTHLSARGEQTSTPANTNECYANLDLPSITEALNSGDWARQYASVKYIEDNALATVTGKSREIIDTLAEVDLSTVDIVTIFIGTNDAYNAQLGAAGDKTPVNNIYGGMYNIVKNLLTKNPNLKIYYFSPILRYFATSWEYFNPSNIDNNELWSDNYVNTSGVKFVDLVSVCLDAARVNKIPACDMYNTLGVNEWNFKSIMLPEDVRFDGTHPYRGLGRIADRIYQFIVANL